MPKRLALASVLLFGAVVALLWNDGGPARGSSRAAAFREDPRAPEPPTLPVPPAGKRLFGRVVDEADGAVAGASVVAYSFATGQVLRVTSGEDGAFDLPDATASQLVVRYEGFGHASLRVAGSDDPVVIRLSKGVGIRGHVVCWDDGAPVSPCRVSAVRVQGEDEEWDPYEPLFRQLLPEELAVAAAADAGPDGVFELAGLAPGTYELLTVAEGFSPDSHVRHVELLADATAKVEVRLPRTAPFFVDVIDQDTGAPLDGARFETAPTAQRTAPVPLPAECHGNGVYELRRGLFKGNFRGLFARVSRDGYAPRLHWFHGGWPGYHARAALGRGATVAGHVRTSIGPLSGALVLVENWRGQAVVAKAVGADGGFELAGLDAPEDMTVHVFGASLEPITHLKFLLRAGERRVLEIGGAGGTAIEGRVVLGGAPVAATVEVSGPSDSEAVTDADGAYRIEGLIPGRYDIDVTAHAFKRGIDDVDVAAGHRLRLDVVVPCLIAGTVVDLAGAPVTDIRDLDVVARRIDVPTAKSVYTEADEKGCFRLFVDPGIYEIDAATQPWPDLRDVYAAERPRVDVTRDTEPRPVQLRVVPDPNEGRIVLDVADARTGDPVPAGEFWQGRGRMYSDGGKFTEARIEAERLAVGVHLFRVWSDAHAPSRVEIPLTPGQKAVRQTILLQPSEAIRVGHIERGAPEAIAGLREDDVILSFTSVAALRAALASARGAVAIEVERAGERRTVTLPAGEIDADLENILLGR